MKVILQKDIPNLGEAGDVKEVANGYARNYLLPNNLVLVANESSKRAIEHQNKLIRIKKEKRKKEIEKVSGNISGKTYTLKAKSGEEDKLFGSVTSMDIAEAIANEGTIIDKKKIILDEPIKALGEYEIEVKLGDGVSAKIKVVVEKEA